MSPAPLRRWVSEAQVLHELEALNDTSMALCADYAAQAVEAATKEADYKRLRAQRILAAKATKSGVTGKPVPTNEAEVIADADDEVATAYLERLTSAAVADATRESIRSVRTNQDVLRTAAASHRDMIAGPGWSGKR